MKFQKGIPQRTPDDLPLPDSPVLLLPMRLPNWSYLRLRNWRLFQCCCHIKDPQNVFPAAMSRCSRMGPRLKAGKNVSAPTMTITPIRSTVNSGVVTGKVPRDGGTYFLPARFPAMASMGIIMRNRPASMVNPRVVSYQSVFTVRPANADPLLPAPDVYA